MFVSLDLVKKHLNIESSYTGDDSYLNFLIPVAEGVVEKHICTNLYDLCKDDGSGNLTLPLPLQSAILLCLPLASEVKTTLNVAICSVSL